MIFTSTSVHADKTMKAFRGHGEYVIKFGDTPTSTIITMFLPEGTNVQPIIDAFNEAVRATSLEQVAA